MELTKKMNRDRSGKARWLVMVVLVVFFYTSLCNSTIQNIYGEGLYTMHAYKLAYIFFERAAKDGNMKAQKNLGDCYKDGRGVEQSYEKEVEWYRKAAEQGDAEAQCNLGYCYANGQGVEQSDEKAVEWWNKSAKQGYAASFYMLCGPEPEDEIRDVVKLLGRPYEEAGYGVEQSEEKAVEWYRKATEQGDAEAQYMLGCCYAKGRGVEQSYEKAIELYQKAAEQGNADAREALERLMKN